MTPIPEHTLTTLETLIRRERLAAQAVDGCAIDERKSLLVVYQRARELRDTALIKYGMELVAECREYRQRVADLQKWEEDLKSATEREALIAHLKALAGFDPDPYQE